MKTLMLSPLPPYFGGSAYSCMELCMGLNGNGFSCLAVAPFPSSECLPKYPFPLIRLESAFHTDGKKTPQDWVHNINCEISDKIPRLSDFDLIILGRESFLWHLPYIRRTTSTPVVLIVRGAYINSICKNEVETSICRNIIELYKSCDMIIAVANHLGNKLRNMGLNNVKVIPNAINHSIFKECAIDHNSQRIKKLLFAGQLKFRKRPFHAMKAFRNASGALNNVQFDIAGKGPDFDNLKKFCEEWNLLKNVNFLGVVDSKMMPKLLESSNVIILPSVDEGLSRIVLEAQAIGRCVLAYDCDGNKEAIEHAKTGYLVPTNNIDALSESLLFLLSNKGQDFCNEIGKNAARKAAKWTTQDQMNLYRTVLINGVIEL